MTGRKGSFGLAALASALLVLPGVLAGQEVAIGDLVTTEGDVPVRLVGYGLVVGLDGTGDRATGRTGARHTVQSVANLLRNFNIEVPPELLRTRNVAAVLVTAEVSSYLRAGGRFETHVSSVGDAVSLRGGVLWATPLVDQVGGRPFATAQGPLVISEGVSDRGGYTVETTARIPGGGLLHVDLPRVDFASTARLGLRRPELGTATRIAQAIDTEFGDGTATVEDPGSIALSVPDGQPVASFLARVAALGVVPDRRAQVIIDGRDGTVVAGGNLVIGEAVVSHGLMTLAIGGTAGEPPGPGGVRVQPGASVQDVATALHTVGAPPRTIGAIFESLQRLGALAAEVVIR